MRGVENEGIARLGIFVLSSLLVREGRTSTAWPALAHLSGN